MTERDPRPASRRPRPLLVGALLLVLQVLTACVVVREERPSAPVAPEGGDIPEAEPLALEPASDRRLPGSLGWALLGSQVTEAVLEVSHAGDTRLSEEALSALEANLVEHGGKATVRRVVRRELPVQEVYSQDDLRSLAAQREHSSGNGTVSVQVLVLPGRFEVEDVPGAAFEATSFAVFPDQVRGRLPAGANVAAFETAVVVHELGHLFGLVNLTGQGSFHEDEDHPGHSRHDNSPMHPAVESGSLASVFGSGPPTEFTDDDRREMQAIRERTSSGAASGSAVERPTRLGRG